MIIKFVNAKDNKEFDNVIKEGYAEAKMHMCPYVEREKIMLKSIHLLN